MSEQEHRTPKRKLGQFHLITAILLVLIAGILIGANVTDRMLRPEVDALGFVPERKQYEYGWPVVAAEVFQLYNLSSPDPSPSPSPSPTIRTRWNRMAVTVNSFVAIGILISVAFTSEWLIRRREARRT